MKTENSNHVSGFVNIVGNPNVGKSTLVNALVKEKLSIVTSKPQTTRHRIHALLNDENFQIVFSDTPGVIKDPRYKMQENMNKFAFSAFEDADIVLFVTDVYEEYTGEEPLIRTLQKIEAPVFVIINKIDQDKEGKAENLAKKFSEEFSFSRIYPISAQEHTGTDALLQDIIHLLPAGPPYYPKDELSDKPERFFASEIIREKILMLYRQEVPYSCEVVVHRFKEEEKNGAPLLMIYADIYVDRKSQKPIIIGHKGEGIKKLGMTARTELESFFNTHVFLDLHVKIKENWRDDDKMMRHFGYNQPSE